MTTGAAASDANPAGVPVPAAVSVEKERLKFYASLLVTILMDAGFLAIWLAAIVAVHAEYEWAKKSVPAATTFMEVLEWVLLVVTAATLLAWVTFDALRVFKTLWRSR